MTKVGEPYINACHCGKPKNVRWAECNDCIEPGCAVCQERRAKERNGMMSSETSCSKDHVNWGLAVAVVVALAFMGFIGGLVVMDNDWKKRSVKEGHAKWVVVDDAGETRWEWLPK